jgi:hypothetical protein
MGDQGLFYVEVSDQCREAKPWFAEEPPPSVIKEIQEYVAANGASHTWRGHTHTRAPNDAVFKYLGRFELPEAFQRAKRFLVCPICRPRSANFGRRPGFIAWFPDERVIRLIGPDCFVKINKEGHDEAIREFLAREKQEKEFAFLVSRRDQHRLALTVLMEARKVAGALDTFGDKVRLALDGFNVDLWRHVRTGELLRAERYREIRPNHRDPANPSFVDAERPVRYGSLDGHKLLDPKAKKLAPKFEAAPLNFLDQILAVDDEDWNVQIQGLDDRARRGRVKELGDALKAAVELRGLVAELRAFLAPVNLGTLRRWGSEETEGRPIDVYARREGSTLRIGSSETRARAVQIPPELEIEIPSAEPITALRAK